MRRMNYRWGTDTVTGEEESTRWKDTDKDFTDFAAVQVAIPSRNYLTIEIEVMTTNNLACDCTITVQALCFTPAAENNKSNEV